VLKRMNKTTTSNIDKLKYIEQNVQQFQDIASFLTDEVGHHFLLENNSMMHISFNDLLSSKNKRYMVVAEPGYGKTRLLKETVISYSNKAFFIDAKRVKGNIIESIKECKYFDKDGKTEEDLQNQKLFKNIIDEEEPKLDSETIVCIDALDEVPFCELYGLFDKIKSFIDEHKEIKLILSCRTHHIQKISYDIKQFNFKYIEPSKFSYQQIEAYLEDKLETDIKLDELQQKSKMSDLVYFLATPRYLYYFVKLLKEGSIDEIVKLSRAEIFENFIYHKLDKELSEETPQSQIDLLKRVLEKLALIMKINQTSTITKDELMTVFDKMDSNFSQIAFRDDLLEKLYDRTLIKDNIDSIEFENQEFLDCLSAKELARFEKVEQIFFDIAIESHINEVYPEWLYVLPFLFEIKPFMVKVFLDYLDRNIDRALNQQYFNALLSVEADSLDEELKSRIFDMVFDYHSKHKILFFNFSYGSLRYPLARYYSEDKYQKILDLIDDNALNSSCLDPCLNAIDLVGALVKLDYLDCEQINEWKKKIEKWLKLDPKKYKDLHDTIVSILAEISPTDFEWIKSLHFIFTRGVEVQDSYARICNQIEPNSEFSIDIYLDTHKYYYQNKVSSNTKNNNEYEYILNLDNANAMIYAFDKIFKDSTMRNRFAEVLKDKKIKDRFKNHLCSIYNEKLSIELKVLAEAVCELYPYMPRVFAEVLLEKDNSYLPTLIKMMSDDNYHYRTYCSCLAQHIDDTNFDTLVKHLDIFGKEKNKILFSLRHGSSHAIKNKIERLYPEKLEALKEQNDKQDDSLCDEWSKRINEKQDRFSEDLFKYFNQHKEKLLGCVAYEVYYAKTCDFAIRVLYRYNPLSGTTKKDGNRSTTTVLHYFKDLIEFAHSENLNLSQEAVDNIFRYLPYAINSEYKQVLDVAKNPSRQAIEDIVNVYAGKREDDLGVCGIKGLIGWYERTGKRELEPILLGMLEEDVIDDYIKEIIIIALPVNVLPVNKIKNYMSNLDENTRIYKNLYRILIAKYQDKDTIVKTLKLINGAKGKVDEKTKPIISALPYSGYPVEEDKKILMLSIEYLRCGEESNANFLVDVIRQHIKHMISKDPVQGLIALNEIEKFASHKNTHLLKDSLVSLKEDYLSKQKNINIAYSIKKYNELYKNDYLSISSTVELLETVKEAIGQDIRRWVEDKGAYKHIGDLATKENRTHAEDFIQKSMESQVELALLNRKFRKTDFILSREAQTMDDKRTDFIISYGFIGSIVLELKLSHNLEAITTCKQGKEYISKLNKYIEGSSSSFGLFMIFNIKDSVEKFEKQILDLRELYAKEDKITIVGLDCVNV